MVKVPEEPQWAVAEARVLERVAERMGVEVDPLQPGRWRDALRAVRVFNQVLFAPGDPVEAKRNYHDTVASLMDVPEAVRQEAVPYARMVHRDLSGRSQELLKRTLSVFGRNAQALRAAGDIREFTRPAIVHGGLAGSMIAVRAAMSDVPIEQAAELESWIKDAYGYVYGRNISGNLKPWAGLGVVSVENTLQNRHYLNGVTTARTKPHDYPDLLQTLQVLNTQPTGRYSGLWYPIGNSN